MKNPRLFAFSLVLLASLFVNESLACTTFCLKNGDETLFGRNYDWMIGDGLVFVNKRNLAKSSTAAGAENPARWTSRYGSVTFNQYGRENPMGGMNEAGLVVELMWLDEARYPVDEKQPSVDVLEWVQYNLDTAATVDEVLRNAAELRISSRVTLHYLVSDKTGAAATVEFLDGRLVARAGAKLEVAALANDTYEKSLAYAKTTAPDRAGSESSFDRFTRAAQSVREFAKKPRAEKEAVAYAFETLQSVAQKNGTQWSVVYDQRRGRIHFRTRQSRNIKTIDVRAFDYSCAAPVRIFDVNARDAGDVTAKFVDYTSRANRDLIERSFTGTPFLKDVSPAARDLIAVSTENFGCGLAPVKAERKAAEPAGVFAYLSALYRFFLS
jgi:penicillin V acylase-like amidase (Ntn superfamily)